MSTRLLLRVSEAAEALGLSRSMTYALIERGVLPSVRLEGSVRVPVRELEALVASRTRTTPGADDRAAAEREDVETNAR